MSAGPLPLGYAYFAAVKLAGYSAAGALLRKTYGRPDRSIFALGLARTVIGVCTGVVFGGVWLWIASHFKELDDGRTFYVLLLPIRLGEWTLLVWWLLDRTLAKRKQFLQTIILGTIWSYALDVIAVVFAWVAPGGFWVC